MVVREITITSRGTTNATRAMSTSRRGSKATSDAEIWPGCLRDASGFHEKLESLTYDRGCRGMGPIRFYARWLTNFEPFLGVWSALVGAYARILPMRSAPDSASVLKASDSTSTSVAFMAM